MMSLYPTQGPVISANSGRATTTRAALQSQVETFWQYVGSNMRNPRWEWTSMHFDVLSPSAAVMTATYQIPHLNPHNMPHTISGAWTAVFANRGGRWVIIQEHLSDTPPPQVAAPAQPTHPPTSTNARYSPGSLAATDALRSERSDASPLAIADQVISFPFRKPFLVTFTPSGEIVAMCGSPLITISRFSVFSSLVGTVQPPLRVQFLQQDAISS
jgi:hypothetical protein